MTIRLLALVAMSGVSMAACSNNIRALNLAPAYHEGTVHIERLSIPGNLYGSRMLTQAARKSADFWYFDAFSSSTNQTLNIVFFNSGDSTQ
ncbi:hypothetical protein MPH_11825 [Macrophomina phaseolina MS6]|uniref:Diels-Alderase N-terminal domain-containing protein n=1 Tax=Macrophomina phaseolina (strain MS6) TaxID=1126212 RepID=K2RDW6_MACPH|nr:hypothetical protein MPH_11825 [Macrophomina phaseolina MS6]